MLRKALVFLGFLPFPRYQRHLGIDTELALARIINRGLMEICILAKQGGEPDPVTGEPNLDLALKLVRDNMLEKIVAVLDGK